MYTCIMDFILFTFCTRLSALEPRSHLKVKCLSLCFISALFFMKLGSNVQFTEVMSKVKIKVTLGGQMFEFVILVRSESPTFLKQFL